MCGFAGFIEFIKPSADCKDLLRMQKTIEHRGPDDRGYYFEPGVGLCHARLAIIDLSDKAHQPMRRGDLTLLYNGEIYNYREIRKELADLGHTFQSNSDTEVLLEAYREWGKDILLRLNGMFAFAIYDHKKRKLFLARDRLGIKPLFYYLDEFCFVFSSEIKAIKAYPGFIKKISQEGLRNYLEFGYTTGAQTIWENVSRVLPSQSVSVDVGSRLVESAVYWNPYFTPSSNGRNLEPNFQETVQELESLLIDEFRRSLMSDVPLGACISGGVDSNVLISLIVKKLGFRLKTYSLGSEDSQYDENASARAVAGFLGTEHTALTLHPDNCRQFFLDTIRHYDEPMSDQNILSFRLIARLAREEGIRVLLSGAGGDELFLGYPNVFLRKRIQPLFHIPRPLRRTFPQSLCRFSNKLYKGAQLLRQENY